MLYLLCVMYKIYLPLQQSLFLCDWLPEYRIKLHIFWRAANKINSDDCESARDAFEQIMFYLLKVLEREKKRARREHFKKEELLG